MTFSYRIALLLAVAMFVCGCVKYTPCPDPAPLQYPEYESAQDASIRHIFVGFAPEDEQTGKKVETVYGSYNDYYKHINMQPAFADAWKSITGKSVHYSHALNQKSNNELTLGITITELYAPNFIQHILSQEDYDKAHVSAIYELKQLGTGKVLMNKQYSAVAECKAHQSENPWKCDLRPNPRDAFRKAVIALNDQFLQDVLKLSISAQPATHAMVSSGKFTAMCSLVEVDYAEKDYGFKHGQKEHRANMWSDLEKQLKQSLVEDGWYAKKSPRHHKVYANIKTITYRRAYLFGSDKMDMTVEYKVVSYTGKKKPTKKDVVYTKTIATKVLEDGKTVHNLEEAAQECVKRSLAKFFVDLEKLAEKNPDL